jgi:NADH-quinone oxidoreductase subunit F
MMTAADAGIRMDFDTLAKAGSMLGSAAVIVMDETTCIVRSTLRLAKFFAHESCGQCTPCREGTNWMRLILQRIERGDGSEADLDLLAGVVPNVGGISLCALGDAAQGPVKSMIARFGDEIRDNIRNRRYPLPRQPFFDFGAVA